MSKSFGAETSTDEVLEGVKLSGKRVLVTGVSAGLGVETARTLAAHGAEVVGAARDLTKAKAATASVRADAANRGSLELVQLDLATLDAGAAQLAEQERTAAAAVACYAQAAAALSQRRRTAAEKLDKAVNGELKPLRLEQARFLTAVETSAPGPDGIDRVFVNRASLALPGAASDPCGCPRNTIT